ncbi:hypothetical protein L1049_008090 [Liquidambar formosana]|uniref:C2H2-type domain-containing protein n=1 Tax=Liquidambar formosana TaxID=63359 RepID=A0AAP0X234_LIQFO
MRNVTLDYTLPRHGAVRPTMYEFGSQEGSRLSWGLVKVHLTRSWSGFDSEEPNLGQNPSKRTTCIEKSEQIAWSADEQGSAHVRSYTCTFCKRGFSNAQALGGHMNIHRRDRAKLKQSAYEDHQLSVDITAKDNPSNHPQTAVDKDSLQPKSSGEKSCTLEGKDGNEQLRQLPLFVDTLSASGHKEKRMELGHGSSQMELDLELRLGPERSTTGTRNFF